jgi:dihydroneopterin aldolase
MLGIFKSQTGTKVKMVVEYELDYDEKITKDNVNDIVDMNDLIRDPQNIVAIRDLKFKTISN